MLKVCLPFSVNPFTPERPTVVHMGHLETPVLRSTVPLRSAVEQEDWSLRLVSFLEPGSAGLKCPTRVSTETGLAEASALQRPLWE